jgi:hypothetical protein
MYVSQKMEKIENKMGLLAGIAFKQNSTAPKKEPSR